MVLRSAVMLGALTAASGCVAISGSDVGRYVERETRRFSTTGKPDVELSTFDGSIEIRSWDRPEVEVIVEKRGPSRSSIADIEVNASQSGNHITVETRWASRTGGFHLGWSRSARLIVSVPASSDLLAKSGDGSIDVEHVDGRIELRSGDGSIRGHDIGGNLNVQTGDGSITVDGSFAGLRAHSGDGRVRVQRRGGRRRASSDWEISTGDGSRDPGVARRIQRRSGRAHRRRWHPRSRDHGVERHRRDHAQQHPRPARVRWSPAARANGRRLDHAAPLPAARTGRLKGGSVPTSRGLRSPGPASGFCRSSWRCF